MLVPVDRPSLFEACHRITPLTLRPFSFAVWRSITPNILTTRFCILAVPWLSHTPGTATATSDKFKPSVSFERKVPHVLNVATPRQDEDEDGAEDEDGEDEDGNEDGDREDEDDDEEEGEDEAEDRRSPSVRGRSSLAGWRDSWLSHVAFRLST